MKKFAIFLISATLLICSVNLNAQTDGCQFRFLLVSPPGFGWASSYGLNITVDDIDYGTLKLPWGTPSAEYTLLLPSGKVKFSWLHGVLNGPEHYFEIYNSLDELIYTSPDFHPTGLLFTYQNKCPECLPLTDFESEYNQEAKVVNLSWVAPESEYVTGFDIFRNGKLIGHVDSTANSYATQTDTLETGTYKYCVVPVYPFTCDLEEKCFETYINNVGIKNYSFDFLLYPNPASNELRITNYELRITDVVIYDIYGRMQKAECRKQNAEDTMIVNISNLPNGIYFVMITTEKGIVTKKVIKQ